MTDPACPRPYADLPAPRPMKHKHPGGPKPHTVPLETRLWDEVDKTGDCWLWNGALNWKGYGRIGIGNGKTAGVHRVAYQLTYPDRDITAVQLDHTCHSRDKACRGDRTCLHRRCVNPAHLEEVDNYTNTLRSQNFMAARLRGVEGPPRTHCREGHELTPDNVYLSRGGGRECKECKRKYAREYWKTYSLRPGVKARAAELARLRYRQRADELDPQDGAA